jgi:hypothetical protein
MPRISLRCTNSLSAQGPLTNCSYPSPTSGRQESHRQRARASAGASRRIVTGSNPPGWTYKDEASFVSGRLRKRDRCARAEETARAPGDAKLLSGGGKSAGDRALRNRP